MQYTFNHYDNDHKSAVNSCNTNYYNSPITITIGPDKYILGLGTKDTKNVIIKDDFFYIVSQNNNLGYISLTEINTTNKVIYEAFLNSFEIDEISPNLLDLEPEQQIKILIDYLN